MLGAGLAVGALQVGIGVALLSTFAGGAIRAAIHHQINAHQWTYVPPPRPRPTPSAHAAASHDASTASPQPAIAGLSGPTELTLLPISPLPALPGNDAGLLTDFPLPKQAPALPPVAARPLGDPGAWITPNDYPSRALREGWSGVTRMHLVIDSGGHVSSCTVTASSGHAALDAVACEKVAQRAQFSPARDAAGAAREGVYNGAIHWMIHEE
jgi:protein TonB